MGNPLISVIVPIYGIEKYLGICIESIIKQTYKNLEIILVDDGSNDRCPELCDLYAKKDSRIKVIHKINCGLVSARKAGIKIANGDYATYVDGDDWIEPGYYEWLVKEIGNADLVVAGHSRTLFNKTVHLTNNIENGIYEFEKLEWLYKNMISYGDFYKPGITTYVWNKLFKKDLLLKYQLLVDDDISIGEDAAVVYPLLLECKKVVVTDNCDYHYRQREDSMLKKTRPFKDEINGLKILYNYLNLFSKKHPKFDLEKQITDFVLSICFMRSGCIEDNNDLILPFEKNFKSKKIAIYSAGTFGQQLVNRINEHNYATIVSWVDEDYWEYRRCCLDVDDSKKLSDCTFDYLLIANVNSENARRLKDELISKGIEKEKILTISLRDKNPTEILKKFIN